MATNLLTDRPLCFPPPATGLVLISILRASFTLTALTLSFFFFFFFLIFFPSFPSRLVPSSLPFFFLLSLLFLWVLVDTAPRTYVIQIGPLLNRAPDHRILWLITVVAHEPTGPTSIKKLTFDNTSTWVINVHLRASNKLCRH